MTAVIYMNLRETKKEQTRTLLIAAAIDLISRQGIEATTIDQIAAAAQTGKGTFYNYFEAKEDVIVAFMAEIESKSLPAAKRYAEMESPLAEILEQFAWKWMLLKRNHRDFVGIFLARMITPGSNFLPYAVEMQVSIDRTLTALFGRLQERGWMTSTVPMPQLILNFKTMHLGLTMLWLLEPAPWPETKRTLKSQMAMFASGVAQ